MLTSVFYLSLNFNTFKDPKRLSWLFSLITSTILTIGSIPFIINLINQYPDFTWLKTETFYSKFLCSYFLVALSLDLLFGVVYYLPFLNILTGWIHHTSYIVLLLILINKKLTTYYSLMCLMEFPTLILSLGSIWKPLRNDLLFGTCFFLTRILYHNIMIFTFYYHLDFMFPVYTLLFILPLHLHWFHGFILQQKRMRAKLNKANINVNSPLQQSIPLNKNYSK
ncbi:hypothetical protein K502DRAFT_297238 [Neoconidiobolus thromboides FSU 785]|nr:hypothetical protein K502DRAFT_297238 [Neoconidiobolus thromboides FSU 785]